MAGRLCALAGRNGKRECELKAVWLRRTTGLLVVFALLFAACSTAETPTEEVEDNPADLTATVEAAATPTPVEPTLTPDPFPDEGPWAVTFETDDGVLLTGTVYGKSTIGLVLVPMYPGGQDGWRPFAQAAAEAGYRALTLDLRGYDESEGNADLLDGPLDVAAAAAFLRAYGSETIFVFGSGEGGVLAAQYAVENTTIAGLAVLSSQQTYNELSLTDSDLAGLAIPSLWVAARQDMAHDIETMADLAGGPGQDVWIYEGSSLHGTYIFEGADGGDLIRRLLDFVAVVSEG